MAIEGDHRSLVFTKTLVHAKREGVELGWSEFRFVDPIEHREAFTRLCIARGSNIQALITMDYWPEDAARFRPVWEEALRSLQLGKYIQDPTTGV